jgi:hypothetical protein
VETVAAYRFWDNPEIGLSEMLSGHKPATLARIQAQEGVFLVQATTLREYGTMRPQAGLEPV